MTNIPSPKRYRRSLPILIILVLETWSERCSNRAITLRTHCVFQPPMLPDSLFRRIRYFIRSGTDLAVGRSLGNRMKETVCTPGWFC